jgi:lecithin-cholesterol acyltransferase
VGLGLPDLSVGQAVDFNTAPVFTRDGDGNQEDLTNDAAYVWQDMPCYHFEMNDNVGVDHFGLVSSPAVLNRLLTHLQRPKSICQAS